MKQNHDFYDAAARRLRDLSVPLLDWYGRCARVLPWRENTDPYRVWISEIMLQQTRVEAVIPYYLRFLERLPDIASLAAVPENELLKLWEGLGYYSRARNLQKAARVMTERHGGRFPSGYEEILALPGIGPYTAGAIGSIAFELPTPAVDGNVLRVLSRMTRCAGDIALPGVKAGMTRLTAALFPASRRGDFTQSLMELGATVCLPGGSPKCIGCPVSRLCGAYAAGEQGEYPVKAPKKARRRERLTVLLLISGGKAAVRKRPEGGLLGGLWEFPCAGGHYSEREIPALAEGMGLIPLTVGAPVSGRHIFTHVEWDMRCFPVFVGKPAGDFLWVSKEELAEKIPLPGAFHPFRALLFDLF